MKLKISSLMQNFAENVRKKKLKTLNTHRPGNHDIVC